MTTFILTILVLHVVGALASLVLLGAGHSVTSAPKNLAFGLLIKIGFIAWAAFLLFSTGANQ